MTCVYTTEDDGRGTAPKSYVRVLQARISLLEKILWLHSIDVDASAAQLMKQNAVPATTTSLAAGGSTAAFDQLCDAFEGTLSLDESQNFDQDGQARYFGPTSGRLDFKTCNGSFLSFPIQALDDTANAVPQSQVTLRKSTPRQLQTSTPKL